MTQWINEPLLKGGVLLLLVVNAALVVGILLNFRVLQQRQQRRRAFRSRMLEAVSQLPQEKEPLRTLLLEKYSPRQKRAVLRELRNSDPSAEQIQVIRQVLQETQFRESILDEMENQLTLEDVFILSRVYSKRAFGRLMVGTRDPDFDIRYSCFHALVSYPFSEESLLEYMQTLITSDMRHDRKVELLQQVDVPVAVIMGQLESAKGEEEPRIYLQLLEGRIEESDTHLLEKLEPYLTSTMEVRIAAVRIFCHAGNGAFFPLLEKLYQQETEWQVLAVLAKELWRFGSRGEALLHQLERTEYWWVRQNAAASLKKIGAEVDSALLHPDFALTDLTIER